MKVFTVTAALICLVLAATTWPAVESAFGDDMKRDVFTKLCEVECTKLKCAGSEPLPDTNECTCSSCDMGPVEEDNEKDEGQTKSTLDHLRLQFYMKGTNTTTNSHHTLTREQSSPTEEGTETLNKTCAMECSRLDCGLYTFDVNEHKCLCASCDLEAVRVSEEGQSAGKKRRKRNDYSCDYRSIRHNRVEQSHTCTGWWRGKRCYNYYKRVPFYISELCCRPLNGFSGEITIEL